MMDEGKLSLDMLIGLSIFLFTFIFVAQFLPSIFADVRHEIALANQAYRIAALLVEDPGYPDDWENSVSVANCTTQTFRIGLAYFDTTTGTHYNEVNGTKAARASELLSDPVCREVVRSYLGLDLSGVGLPSYSFRVRFLNLSGSPITISGNAVLDAGDDMPAGGQIVKFERIVYFDGNADNCDIIAGRCVYKLEVLVWI